MAEAKSGDTVKVHYTGKLDDGTVFDSSRSREPLEFTLGQNQVISGFEEAVVGMAPGESKTAELPSDQAYGPRYEEMVVEVEKEQMPPKVEPQVGQRLQIRQADGRAIAVTIAKVTDTKITLDGNHPLAGKDLTFDIELVDIVA